jgi:hypothetical protein
MPSLKSSAQTNGAVLFRERGKISYGELIVRQQEK